MRSTLRPRLALLLATAGAAPCATAAESSPPRPDDPPIRPAWVFFKDKGGEQAERAAITSLSDTWNERSRRRRAARRTAPGLFDVRDVPVRPEYLGAVGATGAHTRTVTRWFNAVSVVASEDQLAAIQALPFVRDIEPVAAAPAPVPLPAAPAPHAPEGFYGAAADQLDQINLITVHAQGLTGRGVVIGILDTGFRRTHAAFNAPAHPLRVLAEYDFVNGDPNTAPEPGDPPNQHEHGTLILGTLGAYLPGTLVGAAYDARFILAKVEDAASEFPLEEDWFVAGLEFIEANGGDVATSSLVARWYAQPQLNGVTSLMSRGLNIATGNGVHCFQGAGNEGHDANPLTAHLLAPADAFDTITCGAVDRTGAIAGFSSDGPTADARLKPEVLARGVATATVSAFNDTALTAQSGTSLSTPLVAGAAACLVQARPGWSVARMRQALFLTATDYTVNHHPDPLVVRGYGIIDTHAALDTGCTADCDSGTGPGLLDIFDFLCFQNHFASGEPYACDCDTSTGQGVCDVFDFLCFQNAYAAGCP